MKSKFRAFTLVELMVVITIIVVLSTFVAINLTSARKKARDDRRISDIQLIGNALDQYATSHARIYPVPTAPDSNDLKYHMVPIQTKPAIWISSSLSGYINPVPSDPTVGSGYQYYYIYRGDGRKAAVVVQTFETDRNRNNGLCNISSTILNLPEAITSTDAINYCYFISR